MARGKRRQKDSSEKTRKRGKAYLEGGDQSKYAIKHAEQVRGTYRPTSPFYGGADAPGQSED